MTGSSFVGPKGMTPTPLIVLATLLTLLGIRMRTTDNQFPSAMGRQQIGIGIVLLVCAIGLSYWATHPSLERFMAMHAMIAQDLATNGPLVASLIWLALIAPLFPLLILAIPATLWMCNWKLITVVMLVYLLYLASGIAEARYYAFTGPWLVQSVMHVLSVLPGSTELNSRWDVAFGEFRATLGPQCSEFSAVLLFLALFMWIWHRISHGKLHSLLMGVTLAIVGMVVLWCVNVLRIAAVVVLGSFAPTLAVFLFHGSVGVVFFLLFFAIYARVMLWVVRR